MASTTVHECNDLQSSKPHQNPANDTEDDVDAAGQDSEVVLVTGGAGFLGQHIVKHVMEQKEFPVREVRVFDIQPLKWSYGLEGRFQSYFYIILSIMMIS